MKKNILIISYVFPPYPGIGGRRWAKFAKYLHRAGYNVYVIAAKNPFKMVSTFTDDIKELPKENLYYLPAKYPTILLKQPKTLWEKMQYHFWIRVLPFFTKGNYYDRSIFWKKQLHQTIRKITEEKNIDAIIVSGPPFNLVYETIKLKEHFSTIEFIVDYRDEWTFNDVHGFGIISDKRKQVEFDKEKYVCENADKIISPSELIIDYLINRYNLSCEKTNVVEHAYDKDDFVFFHLAKSTIDLNKIQFAFYGGMYDGFDKFLNLLWESVEYIRQNDKKKLDNFWIYLYINGEKKIYNDILSKISNLTVIYSLNPNELFRKLVDVNYIFYVPDYKRGSNQFSTKFYEMLYMRKPILFFGQNGKVSQFIEKNKMGICLHENNFQFIFNEIIQGNIAFDLVNEEFVSKFACEKVLDKITLSFFSDGRS